MSPRDGSMHVRSISTNVNYRFPRNRPYLFRHGQWRQIVRQEVNSRYRLARGRDGNLSMQQQTRNIVAVDSDGMLHTDLSEPLEGGTRERREFTIAREVRGGRPIPIPTQPPVRPLAAQVQQPEPAAQATTPMPPITIPRPPGTPMPPPFRPADRVTNVRRYNAAGHLAFELESRPNVDRASAPPAARRAQP